MVNLALNRGAVLGVLGTIGLGSVHAQEEVGELQFVKDVVEELGFLPYADHRLREIASDTHGAVKQIQIARTRSEVLILAIGPQTPGTAVLDATAELLKQADAARRNDALLSHRHSHESAALDLALGNACLYFVNELYARSERSLSDLRPVLHQSKINKLISKGLEALERAAPTRPSVEAYLVSLVRALLMAERARVTTSDRDRILALAEAALEEVALELDCVTLPIGSIMALAKLSELKGIRGHWDLAIEGYTDNLLLIEDCLQEADLPDRAQEILILHLQKNLALHAEACLAHGDLDGALRTIRRFGRRAHQLSELPDPRSERSIMRTERAVRKRTGSR